MVRRQEPVFSARRRKRSGVQRGSPTPLIQLRRCSKPPFILTTRQRASGERITIDLVKLLPARARGRFTRSIPWSHLLVPGTLVQGPDRLLDLWVADNEEAPALQFPPLGAHTPASSILRISSFGTGSGFSRRIERV